MRTAGIDHRHGVKAMTTNLHILRFAALAAGTLVAASAPAAAQDKVIKIGALLPMSGPGSYFGAQDKQGVDLALEQLNSAGVNGYKLDVQYEDSACSPLPATQAAKRLHRAVQARRRDRRGMLRRDARDHADDRAGQGAVPQRRLVRRSRSPSPAIPGPSASCRTR